MLQESGHCGGGDGVGTRSVSRMVVVVVKMVMRSDGCCDSGLKEFLK